MADNVGYTPGAGAVVAADEIAGVLHQRVKLGVGADGVAVDVSSANPMPVTGTVTANTGLAQPLTDTQLRAVPLPISGTVATGLTQPLTDAELRAAEVPVSVAILPLPSGAATEANQSDVLTAHPLSDDRGSVVRQAPADIWVASFSKVGLGLLETDKFTRRDPGTGMTASQASGNLLVATGTTANSEFLARSLDSWNGALTARYKTILSQRIVNQNFVMLLADRIGEGLSCTINSAVSITVNKTAHGFTSANVGQSMYVGAINGAAGVPGRYAISSIPNADTINFTVAGWPATGSCTLDLFGWNYIRAAYSGASTVNVALDAQRNGWNSGDTTVAMNTSASPGHVVQIYADGRNVSFADSLLTSATVSNMASRASRIEMMPDDDVELYWYIWAFNSTTAPVSTTTWTVGFVAVENNANVPTYIAGVRPTGAGTALSVLLVNQITAALAVGSSLTGDVGQQYRGSSTGAASGAHIVSAATTNATIVKASGGRVLGWALANTNASWRYVKLHNQTTTPTAGTGVVRTISIPPNGLAQMKLEGGIAFTTGIGLTTVTGSADADTTAVAVGDIVGELFFA